MSRSQAIFRGFKVIVCDLHISVDSIAQQCWEVFKRLVFKILFKLLILYFVFSILNTFCRASAY